jgi:D-alanyl-D-alanine carboxypeptidase
MAYPSAMSESLRPGGDVAGTGSRAVPLFVMPSISASDRAEPATSAPAAPIVQVSQGDPPPTLQDTASLVADLGAGTVFEATNAARRWPTASITKLVTAAVAVDTLDPTTKITITQEMFAADPAEHTLVLGGSYTVADLFRVLLLPSSNVAAEALADFYGRGKFLTEMNARAAAWGMENTYFDDPSGISATNQSTAGDLVKLAAQIYAHYPQIFQITRTPQATITEQNSGKRITIKSINEFAGDADFVGGKTGNTEQASGNLLSVFRYGDRTIVIVVLGTTDRFGDTQKLYSWFKATVK